MKTKSSKVKQPINLAGDFKTVKSRKKHKNRLNFIIVFSVIALIVALSPFFLLPRATQTKIYDDNIEVETVKENISPDVELYTDVNDIIRQKMDDVELSQTSNKQHVEVKVNIKPSYSETLKESTSSNVKVDKQKINEFFHSSDNQTSTPPVLQEEQLPSSHFTSQDEHKHTESIQSDDRSQSVDDYSQYSM